MELQKSKKKNKQFFTKKNEEIKKRKKEKEKWNSKPLFGLQTLQIVISVQSKSDHNDSFTPPSLSNGVTPLYGSAVFLTAVAAARARASAGARECARAQPRGSTRRTVNRSYLNSDRGHTLTYGPRSPAPNQSHHSSSFTTIHHPSRPVWVL